MSKQLITNAPQFDKDEVRVAWLTALGAEPSAQHVTVAGTTYTLSQEDYGKLLVFTNNASVTVSLPDDSTGDFESTCRILLLQAGLGAVSVVAGTGSPTITSAAGMSTRTQHSLLGLEKLAEDQWLLYGDLIDSGTYDDGEW